MTRPSLSNILSNEEQSLQEVWTWYEFQFALIGEEKGRVFNALSAGTGLAMSRYLGKTGEELEVDFAYQTYELKQLTILGMLACTEAAFRIDFIERVNNKKKDDVSRRFRDIHRRREIGRIRFEEDILDTWKDHAPNPATAHFVAELKGALPLRHWLAHGRYWKPKLGRASSYDVVDVFDICKELLQAAGLFPSDYR